MTRRRVAVIGGGVSGLAAARVLARDFDVTLFEAGARLGGRLATAQFRGRAVDLGPDSFITRNRRAYDLCVELGLAAELVAPQGHGAAIWARGALRPFPTGLALGVPTDLAALWRSGILPLGAVLRATVDLVLPGRNERDPLASAIAGRCDPSVATVIGRRLGDAVVRDLVDPLVGGINAGDARVLSFAATVPQLATRAAGRASLVRALRPQPTTSEPHDAPPLFVGLRNGIARLSDALTATCAASGVNFLSATPVRSLELGTNDADRARWRIDVGDGAHWVDGIVCAVPASAAAALVRPCSAAIAHECAAIRYASVATLTFAWRRAELSNSLAPDVRLNELLVGNGVLVPRRAGRLVTALTFTSTKWPHGAEPTEVVLRASVGRDGDDEAMALDDQRLVERVRTEIAAMTGIATPPLEVRIERFVNSFPQYLVGHLARIARLDQAVSELPAFALAGAAYHGIGIPACIDSGEQAASRVAGALAH